MPDNLIHFFCPYCGIKLSVPSNMAGVSGPCPSCGNPIQAPAHAVEAHSEPRPERRPNPPAQTGAPLKPEPRQLPLLNAGEIVAKRIPQPDESTAAAMPPAYRSSADHRGFWQHFQRVAMLVLFIAASAALVYGVLLVLNHQRDAAMPAASEVEQKSPLPPSDAYVPSLEDQPATGLPDNNFEIPEPTVAVPDATRVEKEPSSPANPVPPAAPEASDPAASPDASSEPAAPEASAGTHTAQTQNVAQESPSPWKRSNEVLEKFFSAGTLAERLPLIESRMSEAELAATCLAGPLPHKLRILPEYRETNRSENRVDCYYNVELEHDAPATRLITVLVRNRGEQEPRVLAGPFLDSFGGRLAAFAASPNDTSGTFQVVVYAIASCSEPEIPNREKKRTLKLLASDQNREIAKAYFSPQSKISEMLENNAYDLNYGSAKPCSVMLRWNHEEDPGHPFLEALTIQQLGWD